MRKIKINQKVKNWFGGLLIARKNSNTFAFGFRAYAVAKFKLFELFRTVNETLREGNNFTKDENDNFRKENSLIRDESKKLRIENQGIRDENGSLRNENQKVRQDNEKLRKNFEDVREENSKVRIKS